MHRFASTLMLYSFFVATFSQKQPQPCFDAACSIESSENRCWLVCTRGLITHLFECASIMATEANCTLKHVNMIVSAEVTYPNETLPINVGLRANIRPSSMKIDLGQVRFIADNAFADQSTFGGVNMLTLNNLNATGLGPNTLVGLNNLTTLQIQNTLLDHLPDFLDGVASTMKDLMLNEAIFDGDSYPLENIFNGKLVLVALERLTIRLSLRQSIKRHVFGTISAVQWFDLKYCCIEHIEPNAFDTLRKLVYLDLSANWLKTLPTEMFGYILPASNAVLLIDLTSNPWECECHLAELQKNMLSYPQNFIGNVTCQKPNWFDQMLVPNTPFCGPIESSTTKDDENGYIDVRCNRTMAIPLKRRDMQFHIRCADAPSTFHIVDADRQPDQRIVVFTAASHDMRVLSYRCGCGQNHPIHLTAAVWHHSRAAHIICVQGTSTRRTLAQNCLAYVPHRMHNGWLRHGDRLSVITVVVAIVTSCLAAGCLLALLTIKQKQSTVEQVDESMGYTNSDCRQHERRLSQCSDASTTHYEELDWYTDLRAVDSGKSDVDYTTIEEPDGTRINRSEAALYNVLY